METVAAVGGAAIGGHFASLDRQWESFKFFGLNPNFKAELKKRALRCVGF